MTHKQTAMKYIILTDKEQQEMRRLLDSTNELVYNKVIYEANNGK